MHDVLNAEFEREEVKAVLDHIGDLKATGTDGMPSVVFKRHWNFMGSYIVDEVLNVVKGGDILTGWNDMLVSQVELSGSNDDKNGVESTLGQPHYEMCVNYEILDQEALSSLLHEAGRRGRITGVKIYQTAPSVSHLFFAHDSMIMLKAKQEEAMVLREVLDLYENCSGQCINLKKLALMFSQNTVEQAKSLEKEALGIHSESWNNRYLGLPVHVGRSRWKVFGYIKKNMCGPVHG
ncbi:hypothetical protein D1007_35703 [Hordeum vulgare]|nr:hypothetical protein D1007_35703 [Hordeum vulgare]